MNNPKKSFAPAGCSRRETVASTGHPGVISSPFPAQQALLEKWNRGMIEARKDASEHKARGESQFAAWKLGYASALESVILDLDGTLKGPGAGNSDYPSNG